jgi:thiol:disulfide interchange protein DsbD
MESIKQFMGFLLMAAVVFLALVAGRLGGVDAVIALLSALLLCGLAAWIYGRWSVPVKSKRTRRMAQLVSLLLLATATWYAIDATKAAYEAYETGTVSAEDGQWSAWSAERVDAELAAGNPVFIDFTASWCLICQANKKLALRTDRTAALFEQHGVVALQADWTRYDAAITAELERFGRSGVPLYVLYAPDGEVTVLPQSLTNGIVREAVENALK